MPRTRRAPPEFRQQIVLHRAGRRPGELFEPNEQTIWIAQADLDEGRRRDGLRR